MSKETTKPNPQQAPDDALTQGGQRPGHSGGQRSGVTHSGKEAGYQGGQHESDPPADTHHQSEAATSERPEVDEDPSRRQALPWEEESKRHRRAIAGNPDTAPPRK